MRLVAIFLYFLLSGLSAQTNVLRVQDFFRAQQYDRYVGEARIAQVRALERTGWYFTDTVQLNQRGQDAVDFGRHDLAPFVDEEGEVEYLVPDIPPSFPGGRKAMERYFNDAIHNIATHYHSLGQALYIRCTIGVDGSISNVMEVQKPYHLIPEAVIQECLDAVRYMPNWSVAVFKGQPVRACIMIPIGL